MTARKYASVGRWPVILPRQVLAEDVGRGLHDLARLAARPQTGRQHHDHVLEPLRQLGHAALAVGQAKLVLGHDVADLEPAALEALGGELGMRGQDRRQRQAAQVGTAPRASASGRPATCA